MLTCACSFDVQQWCTRIPFFFFENYHIRVIREKFALQILLKLNCKLKYELPFFRLLYDFYPPLESVVVNRRVKI